MRPSRYLSSAEAAQELGISIETLYAYVSRGLIRSEPGDDPRSRRYRREDVERLRTRQQQRKHPAKVAEEALHWGVPVLESAITLIADGRLYYRGYDVVTLATTASFEAVAALLWTGTLDADVLRLERTEPRAQMLDESPLASSEQLAALPPLQRCQLLLTLGAARRLDAYDLRPQALARTGEDIVRLMLLGAAPSAQGERGSAAASVARALQRAWLPADERVVPLLDAALILCADHELNVSSFTVRCVASAGAPLATAIGAGLAALAGAKHGGMTARVEALFAEARGLGNARDALDARLRRGESIPGFGHQLYPDGDPRGALLLRLVTEQFPDAPAVALAGALSAEAQGILGERPNLDLALVTLCEALRLPRGSALALFALGRCAGWIAHAREEYARDELIRPRARYTGPAPHQE